MTNLLSERARRMRQDMSDAERRLRNKPRDLNGQGFHFRQQAPIGPYIADFCDHTVKLVLEVDGSQHGDPKGLAADRRRTRELPDPLGGVIWADALHRAALAELGDRFAIVATVDRIAGA